MKDSMNAKVIAGLVVLLNVSINTIAQDGLPAEVIKVEPQELKTTINSIGTLKANHSVVLSPEVSGRIIKIGFKDGSSVHKGMELFKLDHRTQKAQVNEARARVKLSNTEFKRIKKLFKQKAASETDLDSAAANLSINQAQAEFAEAELQKLTIRAPFKGTIGLHNISSGEYVNAGQELVQLVELNTLKLDFSLPETYLSKVELGQKIEITTPAFPNNTYTGTVTAISPAISEQSRSFMVRAIIQNEKLELRPGLFATVLLEVSKNEKALLVPEQALVPQGQQYFVMTVVDGKVAQVPVTIGQRRKAEVELVSGVQQGDVVIIAGQIKLQPGAAVTPLFPEMLQKNN